MTGGATSFIEGPLLPLPGFDELDEAARCDFSAAEHLLRSGGLSMALGSTRIEAAILQRKAIQALEHELSPFYAERNDPKPLRSDRGATERAVADLLVEAWSSRVFPSPSEALSLLQMVVRRLEAGTWRKSDVWCRPDRLGCAVRFPHHGKIRARLLELHERLEANYAPQPLFAATLALCSLSSLHPLTDGNGRLSRIIFNTIVRTRFDPDFHIPLYALDHASNAGYIISLRRAQHHNQWADLAAFILNALLLFSPSGR